MLTFALGVVLGAVVMLIVLVSVSFVLDRRRAKALPLPRATRRAAGQRGPAVTPRPKGRG